MDTVVSLNKYIPKKSQETQPGVASTEVQLENVTFRVMEATHGLPPMAWDGLIRAEASPELIAHLDMEKNVPLSNLLRFATRDLQDILNGSAIARMPMSKTVIIDNGEMWQSTQYAIPLLSITVGSTVSGKTVRPFALTTKLHTFDPSNTIDQVSNLSVNNDIKQVTGLAWNSNLTDHTNLLHPRVVNTILKRYQLLADTFSMGYSYTNTDDNDGNVVLSFTKVVATGSEGVLIAEYIFTINTAVYDVTYEA